MSAPGYRWRLLANGLHGSRFDVESRDWAAGREPGSTTRDEPECFDELVIDDWLHLEQMSEAAWWMDLGGYHLWMVVEPDGLVRVTHDGRELCLFGLGRNEP